MCFATNGHGIESEGFLYFLFSFIPQIGWKLSFQAKTLFGLGINWFFSNKLLLVAKISLLLPGEQLPRGS